METGMWCGQSFRTLAEMTQHMKITQHYTNIISQEQITSWRQPESADAPNKNQGKQSAQIRNLDDNHDDLSEKFLDSDREDSLSNDDELTPQHFQKNRNSHNKSTALIKRVPSPNTSAIESNHGDASPNQSSSKDSSKVKPLTRSRKREHEDHTSEKASSPQDRREISPTNSSSSSQRHNAILSDLNESSETNKESKLRESASPQEQLKSEDGDVETDNGDDAKSSTSDDQIKQDENANTNGNSEQGTEKITRDQEHIESDGDNDNDNEQQSDREDDEKDGEIVEKSDRKSKKRSKTRESVAITTSSADVKSQTILEQKGGDSSGDPLSALETMVEKSFDPRLRPGVANGGILQRLGIDEEVCPPWQHINYANWYAAAAYGHPMAAALLAAGINLQNGIKLSKNVGQRKSDD